MIRPADKGRGVVIHSKEQYQEEINHQLQDELTYVKLLGNPTIQYKKELEKNHTSWNKKRYILNNKEAKFLYLNHAEFLSSILVPRSIKIK